MILYGLEPDWEPTEEEGYEGAARRLGMSGETIRDCRWRDWGIKCEKEAKRVKLVKV